MEGMNKRSGSSSRALVVFLVVALMAAGELRMVRGQNLSPSQCRDERQLLVNACRGVVFGRSPSPACCERVRVSHVECLCPVVDPKLAAVITVQRAIKVLTVCGRRVPHNFQCGSLHFP